jgi:hypothetical protein
MCGRKQNVRCEKPENLKGRPGDCSAEQIRKCHGDSRKHPCAPTGKG